MESKLLIISQEQMLTILDGNLVKDKLFTITVNNFGR